MANRKVLGTILGIIMFAFCLIYFTYAYYTWRSDDTELSFSIEDIAIEFEAGDNVNVNNIGPVLDYNDGVSVEFKTINETTINVPTKINLDITFISENLKTKDFKYILLRDTTGGENYTEKVVSGSFKSFDEGINRIIDCEIVNAKSTYSYKFIVYIDGNEKNNINMQNNRLESFITFEDSEVSYMTTFISDSDTSYFKNSTYKDKIKNVYFVDYINTEGVTASWDMTDLNNDAAGSVMSWVVPNETSSNYYDLYIGSNELIVTNNLSFFFYDLTNVEYINFDNFDTSVVVKMDRTFGNCKKIIELDLSSFNTANVENMQGIFYNCINLKTLDLSNFDTGKVTTMNGMFRSESNLSMQLEYIDISSFDTSNVTTMAFMFYNCQNLIELNVSGFDTIKVTDMSWMFSDCINLKELDVGGFNTSNVTNMSAMFGSSTGKIMNLEYLNISNLDTSKVTNMSHMFDGCINLKTLDLSNFDTSKVTNVSYMFARTNSLNAVITIQNHNTTTYTDMFFETAINEGSSITVNYTTETSTLVDNIINTKSQNSNVIKGSLV